MLLGTSLISANTYLERYTMKKKLLLAAALLPAAYVYSIGGRKQTPELQDKWSSMQNFRYAHRGLFTNPKLPENSASAFIKAAQEGYGCELDVHLTRDGELVVIHDSNLSRACGVDVEVEDLTLDQTKQYTLFESFECMPTLQEVFQIYTSINDQLPIIIEVKSTRTNVDTLCSKVAEAVRNSTLNLCVESFDPRVVLWFKKNYPECMRGQLSQNYFADSTTKVKSMLGKGLLTNLSFNALTKPDFVAYHHTDRNQLACKVADKIYHMRRVDWTVRDIDQMIQAEDEGAVVIFDSIKPQSPRPHDR